MLHILDACLFKKGDLVAPRFSAGLLIRPHVEYAWQTHSIVIKDGIFLIVKVLPNGLLRCIGKIDGDIVPDNVRLVSHL
jgi:hypothetical protein